MAENRLTTALKRHPLVKTLLELEGNPRICVYLEPLWGIPYNLYSPFATLFMYNLGVSDEQIGLLLSIGMVFQVLASLLGGVCGDKWGRCVTTVVFDTISWSIPCLIWAFSQNFWWFLAATILNSMWQITNNTWTCLLVEDCDPKKLVDVYTWVSVSGLLAVFFAPISTALVSHYTLMPVMRGLYLFSFVFMTIKFWTLFAFGRETRQGRIRMQETKDVSFFAMFKGYGGVIRDMLHSKPTLLVLAIIILCNITSTLSGTFFSLYVVQNLGIPEAFITFFPMIRAGVMLLFIFLWQARINALPFKPPMIAGLALFILGQLLLVFAPRGGGVGTWAALVLYVLADAFGNAIFSPRKESLVAMCIDEKERSRVSGLLYVIMIGLCSPFGYIGGVLSGINRILPFAFNAVLYTGCLILVLTSGIIRRVSDSLNA